MFRSFQGLKQGVTLPICAVVKLEWTVIKSKLGSVKILKMSKHIQPQYPIILHMSDKKKKDTETTVTQI